MSRPVRLVDLAYDAGTRATEETLFMPTTDTVTSQDSFLSFRMREETFHQLVARLPDPWEGNVLGHLTFLSKYSRRKPDGSKETWGEVVRRCVEGCYTIQKNWCLDQRIPWSDDKAQRSAAEMFERMYEFKFTPPGRGLWMMGTEFVHARLGSAALQNCAFVSTKEDLIKAAEFLMEASMLGVGVGFDTEAAGEWMVYRGNRSDQGWVIGDSREGWVKSVVIVLDHLFNGIDLPRFDYSQIRGKGEPIKGFGGTAAGPKPLMRLHLKLIDLFADRDNGEAISERDVVDMMNMIGECVVAGNVRRSAEIALGSGDENFVNLKNYSLNGDGEVAHHPAAKGRSGHGWASNNSVTVRNGLPTDLSTLAELIATNGEPGLFWLETSRQYGRLGDPPNGKDYRATGTNPCGEQTLESYEMCNLVETYPSNHETSEDFKRTLKFAYLYAKSVTLLPTHWPETNSIMLRNRRIGCSVTGVFQFAEERGLPTLREWLNAGYDEIQEWDNIYSEWLCVRPSIKTTSVKPSGTVSKIVSTMFKGRRYAQATPGVHAPVERQWIQNVIFDRDDPVFNLLYSAGYPAIEMGRDDGSVLVGIPVETVPVRCQDEVTVWEKASLAALLQREWADNSVSVTLDFSRDEADQIAPLLHAYEGQFKAVSFYPRSEEADNAYEYLPMQPVSPERFRQAADRVVEPMFHSLYLPGADAREAEGDRFCDTDYCEV